MWKGGGQAFVHQIHDLLLGCSLESLARARALLAQLARIGH